MDIDQFKPSGPAKLDLVDMRGEQTGAWIELLSQDEPEVLRKSTESLRKIRNRTNYDSATESVVAATVSWNLTEKGEPYPCTPENARKLYRDAPFIREQVLIFSTERSNFAGN